MPGARIPAGNFIAITGGPDNVGVRQVGNGETGFAAAHGVVPSGFARVDGNAGAAHVSIVLHVAVEVVGNLVVDIHVVHLPDGQREAVQAAPVDRGDVHAAIIGNAKAVGIGGVDPDIVRVPTPGNVLEVLAAVQRLMERTVGYQNLVVGGRGNCQSNVVPGPANQMSLIVDRFPMLAPILGTPERVLIPGLNQCKNAVGVCGCNGDVDLAQRRVRQAMLLEASPFAS